MRVLAGRLAQALLLGTLLAVGQIGVANAASPTLQSPQPTTTPAIPPGTTLAASPQIVNVTAVPGGTASSKITLHSGIVQNLTVQVLGLAEAADGSFTFLAADQDTSAYSGRSMVSVSPVSFQMQPGSDQTITVNVTVPQGAGEGTRYAMLRVAETQGSSGQNVGIGVELGMPVLITLDKTTQTRTGVIQALSADATPGQPLVVKGQIKNTGNTHFGAAPDQISASAALYDATGKAVASGKTTITGDSIVPSFSRDFTITMAAAQDLAAGHYRVEVTAALGGDTLNTAALSFDVSDGQVEGATSGPLESASTASSSGDDTGVVLFALLGGLLLGGLFATVVVLTTRRRMRMGA